MYEVIVNPAARNGQARQIGEEAERYLKEKQVDFVIRYTEYPGHATELARDAANRGVETVIAMGGDGTVCETAAGPRWALLPPVQATISSRPSARPGTGKKRWTSSSRIPRGPSIPAR